MVMNPIPGEAGTDYPVFTEGMRPQFEKLYSTIILSLQCQRQGSIVLSSNICLAFTQTQQQTARWFSYLILLKQWNDLSFVCSLSTCARRTDGQLRSSVRTGQSSTNSTSFVTGEYQKTASYSFFKLDSFSGGTTLTVQLNRTSSAWTSSSTTDQKRVSSLLSFLNHPHLPLKVNDATLSSVSMTSRTRKVLLCMCVCVCR